MRKVLAAIAVLLGSATVSGAGVTLRNGVWSIGIDPATLETIATPAGGTALPLSAGQKDLGTVELLSQSDGGARWSLPARHVTVDVKLTGETLAVTFAADAPGAMKWPIMPGDAAYAAYILPRYEGLYIPADDQDWIDHLSKDDPLDTTEGLSMPFWGIQSRDATLTYLLTNPFGNELAFRSDDGRLGSALTHHFRANWVKKEYAVRITLGPASPIEPAKVYRRYLIETKQFLSMKEKIAKTPDAGKLLGAPHAYVWGENLMGRDDVADYKGFAAEVVRQSQSDRMTPGKHLWSLLDAEARKVLTDLPNAEWVDGYLKGVVVDELTRVMELPAFADPAVWGDDAIKVDGTSTAAISRRSCRLLAGAFPKYLKPVETWGDAISEKFVQGLVDAGFDRFRLALPDAAPLRRKPEVAEAAKRAGFLIGPYDSYNAVHRPGQSDTWSTAQFDQHLFDTGGIQRADGSLLKGFKGVGRMLSPIAARPYVERRVGEWMKDFPAVNSWFMDCDAFGQLYDDYSPAHPATQADDMKARLGRMAWIRDTYHMVIGSEGGSSYAAGTVHFVEGIESPGIGWGDPDLQKDKASPYYLGGYYPSDGPAMFFKPVPLKPAYYKYNYDPRYRVPLYQAALHDSVVATDHWSFASNKLTDVAAARRLQELLYGTPPMYHLNLAEFARQREAMVAYYKVFSPLHRQVGMMEITGFEWLSGDRLVQKTTFGDQVEVVANFSGDRYQYGEQEIPAGAAVVKQIATGETIVYVAVGKP